jgi:hypothetical protein
MKSLTGYLWFEVKGRRGFINISVRRLLVAEQRVSQLSQCFFVRAAGLIGHGLFDFVHGHFISNPGVPAWWPGFCGTYDVVAGAYLAVLLKRSKTAKSVPQKCYENPVSR